MAALMLVLLLRPASGVFVEYDVPNDDYIKEGDLNLGALVSLTDIEPNKLCGDTVDGYYVQLAQALIYSVEKINNDPTILPNITLGLVMLNDCKRQNVALSLASKFIPMQSCVVQGCSEVRKGQQENRRPYYDVAAVVGGFQSKFLVLTSALFSQHRVPHIGLGSSDALSDKVRYEYYTRNLPPDFNRARAMVEILKHYQWTYIATFNSEGSYGELGIAAVHKIARENGICVALSAEFAPDFDETDYDYLIDRLRKHPKVRVLVMFILPFHIRAFFRAVERKNAVAEFVYVLTEGFTGVEMQLAQWNALNVIAVHDANGRNEEFEKYYLSLNPWSNASGSVWYGQYRKEDVQCQWEIPEGQPDSCHNYKTFTDFPDYALDFLPFAFIDQVHTAAYALHNLLHDKCPGAFLDKSHLRGCIRGEELLRYIRNVSFQGVFSYVKFDSKGDIISKYVIFNSRPKGDGTYGLFKVGEWRMSTETFQIDDSEVQFYETFDGTGSNTVVDVQGDSIEVGGRDLVLRDVAPESVCAKPCHQGEFYIQGELSCCWECRSCRNNEIVRPDRQGCSLCPPTFWPEPLNLSHCEQLPPTYMTWEDPIAIGLLALAGSGVVAVWIVSGLFIHHRRRKVVKGSSRELMAIIQLGLFTAFATVVAYIAEPTTYTCYIAFFGFHFSCTLIFGPLFIKTNRLYRIFTAAEKCQTRVRMVDTRSLLIAIGFIIFLQTGAAVSVTVMSPPQAVVQMPVPTEPYVELLCTLPMTNLLAPLSFNILLLFLCSIFGFLTRKLPDNFNESWYIFISVTTTLFVWIAFLPTYFLAFYAYHKSALLALALILNGCVTYVCLYAPKLYALYYIDEKKIQVSTFDETGFDTQTTENN